MVTEPESHPAAPSSRGADSGLDRALAESQFFLLYQPTIDLQTSAFVGVEALLRWRHPARGVVGPDEFLPELEASGRIIEVGRWVLLAACRQGADWHSRGNRFTVSVNVSARQFDRDAFVDDVEHALSDSTFDAAHLVLEFSEGTLAGSAESAAVRLARLRSLGVRIAIDDFGADASSQTVLTNFPIDIVKIDRAFISGIATSAGAATRVHELVQLGKSLNVQTIAQGIEDDDQRLRLQVEDVDVGQGFLFSVPHDAAEIDRYLEDFAIFSGKPL
jgi:EAL domain-containing protein (putative c-di-GMP-specific phosphodiesterase class I)